MKDAMDTFNSGLNSYEDRISKLKNRSKDNIQT